jgi:hypothetical protein
MSDMVTGIGSTIARNKIHGPLKYVLGIDAIFKDRERFLEKFYGCKDAPVNDVVAPFRKVLLVLQNSKFCGEVYRRVEFEFNTVKISANNMPIDNETAIKESITAFPLNCVVRMWNGGEPEPEFEVSPYHLIQNDVMVMRANHFPPGQDIRITVDGAPLSTQKANCMGAMEYVYVATYDENNTVWTIGKHNICAEAYDASISGTTTICQDVYVTELDGSIPKLVICPSYFVFNSPTIITGTVVTGYGFGTDDEVLSADLTITDPLGVLFDTFDIKALGAFSENASMFEYKLPAMTITTPGNYLVEASVTSSDGTSVSVGECIMHVTNISMTSVGTIGAVRTRTITATGMWPNERCSVYVNDIFKGVTVANLSSIAQIVLELGSIGTVEVRFEQNIINAETSEKFVATTNLNFNT